MFKLFSTSKDFLNVVSCFRMFIENIKGTFLCLNEKDETEHLNKWKKTF